LIASFLTDFANSVLANIIGGALVAFAVYFVIERRFRIREEQAKRTQTAHGILHALRDELEHNKRVADALLEHLPKQALPYSGFELTGWTLLSQVPAFTAISASTVNALLDAYLRIRSANEQHALLFDLTYGATGAISFAIAGAATDQAGRTTFLRLEERRDDLRERLLRRVDELKAYLGVALDEVNRDLERNQSAAIGS
jgi:hypothetical protein